MCSHVTGRKRAVVDINQLKGLASCNVLCTILRECNEGGRIITPHKSSISESQTWADMTDKSLTWSSNIGIPTHTHKHTHKVMKSANPLLHHLNIVLVDWTVSLTSCRRTQFDENCVIVANKKTYSVCLPFFISTCLSVFNISFYVCLPAFLSVFLSTSFDDLSQWNL